jgi:hypothetical protein
MNIETITYYEIVPGTKGYEITQKIYNCEKDWYREDIKKELTELLGFDYINKLGLVHSKLYLTEVPEHLKTSFLKTKKWGLYPARENSKINRAYVDFCEKHDLKLYTTFELRLLLTTLMGFTLCPCGDRYFIRFERELREDEQEDFLKIVDEKEYLEAKLKYINSIE